MRATRGLLVAGSILHLTNLHSLAHDPRALGMFYLPALAGILLGLGLAHAPAGRRLRLSLFGIGIAWSLLASAISLTALPGFPLVAALFFALPWFGVAAPALLAWALGARRAAAGLAALATLVLAGSTLGLRTPWSGSLAATALLGMIWLSLVPVRPLPRALIPAGLALLAVSWMTGGSHLILPFWLVGLALLLLPALVAPRPAWSLALVLGLVVVGGVPTATCVRHDSSDAIGGPIRPTYERVGLAELAGRGPGWSEDYGFTGARVRCADVVFGASLAWLSMLLLASYANPGRDATRGARGRDLAE